MTHGPRKPVRATVVTGDFTTEYLCSGSGRPLLVLAAAERRGPLIEAGSAFFRVVAPILDQHNEFGASRIIDLLDGLGLWDVQVAADREYEGVALACAADFPDRIVSVLVGDRASIDLPGALARLAG